MRCAGRWGPQAGATRELITMAVNGLLFDPGDIPGVAAALSQLAADRERLHAMGRSAFEKGAIAPVLAGVNGAGRSVCEANGAALNTRVGWSGNR
jgi:glycosyltransferase involved in cell wall biosynthesis